MAALLAVQLAGAAGCGNGEADGPPAETDRAPRAAPRETPPAEVPEPPPDSTRLAPASLPEDRRGELEPPVAATGSPVVSEHEVVGVGLLPGEERVWVKAHALTRDQLRAYLRLRADTDRDPVTPGPFPPASRVGVLVRADARVRWQRIQWVMQTAADPEVAIDRIWWNVRAGGGKGEAQIPMFLPRDRGLGDVPSETGAAAEVRLERVEGGGIRVVLVRLWDGKEADLGTGDAAFGRLRKQVETLHERNAEARARIRGEPDVPFGDVVRAADAIRGGGIADILLVGAPPPRPGD